MPTCEEILVDLNNQILSIIKSFEGSDYDQRSALGMARTWIEKGTRPEYNPNQVENKRRDDLAKALVAALEDSGAEDDEMAAALAEARRLVNEPFRVETFVGTAKSKPKEQKKLAVVE